MTCAARIRPMAALSPTEIVCDEAGDHSMHRGTLRDYAYPGSATIVQWAEDDRRTFHSEWPGDCSGCILPLGHRGRHVS